MACDPPPAADPATCAAAAGRPASCARERALVFLGALGARLILGYPFLGSIDLINGTFMTRLMLAREPFNQPYFPIVPQFFRVAAVLTIATPLPLGISFKLVPIIADALLALLIYDLVRRDAPSWALRTGLLYAFSPVALIVTSLHSQWEPACLLLLLLGLYVRDWFARDRLQQLTAGALIALSALVKPVTLPFLVAALRPCGPFDARFTYSMLWALGSFALLTFAVPPIVGQKQIVHVLWPTTVLLAAWVLHQVLLYHGRMVGQEIRCSGLVVVGMVLCFVVSAAALELGGGSIRDVVERILIHGSGGIHTFGLPLAYPLTRLAPLHYRLWLLGVTFIFAFWYYAGRLGALDFILLGFAFTFGVAGLVPQYLVWVVPFLLVTRRLGWSLAYHAVATLLLVLYYANPAASYVPTENLATYIPLRSLAWLVPPLYLQAPGWMPVIRFLGNYALPVLSLAMVAGVLRQSWRKETHAPPLLAERQPDPPFRPWRCGYLWACLALAASAVGAWWLLGQMENPAEVFEIARRNKVADYAVGQVVPLPRFGVDVYLGDYARSSPLNVAYLVLAGGALWCGVVYCFIRRNRSATPGCSEGLRSDERRCGGSLMKLTVSMISMNEEGAVGKVIDDIKAVAPEAEILLVDSSSDNTPQIAQARGARVIRQYPPQGYGRAMERALRDASGDVIVTLDCDDTYPVSAIPVLAKLVAEEGYDIVNATRLARRPKAMPLPNYLANWLFAAIASLLAGTRTTDMHSGMRAYRKAMLDQLEFEAGGPALPVELWFKPLVLRFRAAEIPIEYRERIGQTTLNRWASTQWTFKRLFSWRRWQRETTVRGPLPKPHVDQLQNQA